MGHVRHGMIVSFQGGPAVSGMCIGVFSHKQTLCLVLETGR